MEASLATAAQTRIADAAAFSLASLDSEANIIERQDSHSSFETRFLGTVSASLAIALIGAGTGLIAARFLGPNLRGELAAIQLFPTVFSFLAVLGLPQAIVFFSAKAPKAAGSYAATSVVVALLSSVPVIGVGWYALPIMLQAQPEYVVDAGRLYLLLILPQAALILPFHTLQGIGSFRLWNVIRIAAPGLWLGTLFVFLVRQDRDPTGIALSYAMGLLVMTGAITWTVMRRLQPPRRFQRQAVRGLVGYALPNMASEVPSTIAFRIDQVVIAAFLSTEELGFYVVAVAWSSVFLPLLTAFGAALFPRVAGEPDEVKRRELTARATRAAILLTAGSLLVVLPITPFMVPLLFGSSFKASVGPAVVLVAAAGFLALNIVLRDLVRGLGKPGTVLGAQLVGAILTVLGLAILVGPFGIMGAAVASLIGYAVWAAVLVVSTARLARASLSQLLVPTVADGRELRLRLSRFLRSRRRS